MPRRATYNRQGQIIMGAAGYFAGIYSVEKLAEETGIPYRSLHTWLCEDFSAVKFSNLSRIIKATGMTSVDVNKLFESG